MAVTNEQVLAEIADYRSVYGRPCPANHLTAKLGDEALDIINALKKAGTLVGKRGRTGGLVPADTTTDSVSSEDTATDSVADQFAALAAKLAEDSVGADTNVEAAVG